MHFPTILVLILNWNGKKDTIECLDSLVKANATPAFSILVVDNGSTDDSVEVIRNAHRVPILETRVNLGFAGGNNAGLKWALSKPFEWILLLNNDTVVAPDFFHELKCATNKQPQGKIFGAKSYRYSDPHHMDHLGGMWNPAVAEFVNCQEHEEMQQVDYVSGCALFMHRSVPEAIGLLDERFFLLWEESDFCARARKRGMEIWTVPQAKLWHKVSASFTGGKPHMQYFWWRNRLLWISHNCSSQEKQHLYRRLLFKEMIRWHKHALLKTLQVLLLTCMGKATLKHKQKAKRYRAGCKGILHYFLGRFGNCPASLLQTPSQKIPATNRKNIS